MKAKNIKNILIGMLACMSALAACDPIEDESLRDDYQNAGTPITKEELQAAISVTQPFPNQDGVVEGDQYVVLKNSRPDVGGAWHAEWGEPDSRKRTTLFSDQDTLICDENTTYDIWYVGISANQIVETDPVQVVVTNAFDDWQTSFTGAVDKSDITAKKTWTFRPVAQGETSYVCWRGAHGAWKYYNYNADEDYYSAWWNQVTPEEAGPQTMVLEFDGNKITTYDAEGNMINQGSFRITHNVPEDKVMGEFITDIPVIGRELDQGGLWNTDEFVFWILYFDKNKLTLYKPDLYTGAEDWDVEGWYVFYEPVAE